MNAINILQQLISINTENKPGNELDAAKYIQKILEPYGFQCNIQDLGNNRGNLIAEIRNNVGPTLVLNGHLDVVPAIGEWKKSPFYCYTEGDQVYGRGTADMKGGIAAMICAAMNFSKYSEQMHGTLRLVFVADEEDANLGTHAYLNNYSAGDFTIIGEPTELRLAIAHRGVARQYIDIFGVSRHAALPLSDGTDAIFQMMLAIETLRTLNQSFMHYKHDVLPPPSIAITGITGYEKDNIIPGKIELLLDIRVLPGMSQDHVIGTLEKSLDRCIPGKYQIIPHFYMPGGEIARNDKFVNLCLKTRNMVTGIDDVACAFDASCEQCFYVEKGSRTVILGPGSLKQAHTVNEYSSIRQIKTAVDIYLEIMRQVLL